MVSHHHTTNKSRTQRVGVVLVIPVLPILPSSVAVDPRRIMRASRWPLGLPGPACSCLLCLIMNV